MAAVGAVSVEHCCYCCYRTEVEIFTTRLQVDAFGPERVCGTASKVDIGYHEALSAFGILWEPVPVPIPVPPWFVAT